MEILRVPRLMDRDALHEFWRDPPPGNRPEEYLNGAARSAFLVQIVGRHVPAQGSVIELGCNVGRNLNALAQAGWDELTGVEINPDAVAILRDAYPALRWAAIVNRTIEDAIRDFGDSAYDLVFTMAVLEHMHPDSEWVFAEMARVGRVIITIEDERGVTSRHQPRDYGKVFGALGLTEVEAVHCADVEGLGPDFVARVFVR